MDSDEDNDDDDDNDNVCVLNAQASSTLIQTVALRTGRLQRCKCFRANTFMPYLDLSALQVIYTTYSKLLFDHASYMRKAVPICHTEHD